MADIATELRGIAGALRRKIQWPEEAAILEAAADEFERLRLRPMTMEEAVAVLAENKHGGLHKWTSNITSATGEGTNASGNPESAVISRAAALSYANEYVKKKESGVG